MAKKPKIDLLALLPIHIRKKSKNWWYDSKNDVKIHNSNILEHILKPTPEPKDYSEMWYNKL